MEEEPILNVSIPVSPFMGSWIFFVLMIDSVIGEVPVKVPIGLK